MCPHNSNISRQTRRFLTNVFPLSLIHEKATEKLRITP